MENDLRVVAGACCSDENNLNEAEIIGSNPLIWANRVIGIKSRTSFDPSGKGMGMDFEAFMHNRKLLKETGSLEGAMELPTVKFAREAILQGTLMRIATEVMDPTIQLRPLAEDRSDLMAQTFRGRVLPWNPSVNQLGWQLQEMAGFAAENDWPVGIKNGKWLGDIPLDKADSLGHEVETSIETTWQGLESYTAGASETILIHRGFDVEGKGNNRNAPAHNLARRVKRIMNSRENGRRISMFFDPSHSLGPNRRGEIIPATVDAMKLRMRDGSFLYDGILIEAGTSKTDTNQHISIPQLEDLVLLLSKFRNIRGRDGKTNETRPKLGGEPSPLAVQPTRTVEQGVL